MFAELSKHGINIVITSHSNYLFNKLSNLILAKELMPDKISVMLMQMGEAGSFVSKDSMKVDEDGIEDNNFYEVAEDLYMERLNSTQ